MTVMKTIPTYAKWYSTASTVKPAYCPLGTSSLCKRLISVRTALTYMNAAKTHEMS